MHIAIGPEALQFGSWNWIGSDLAAEFRKQHRVSVFRDVVPDADYVIFVKFLPDAERLSVLSKRTRVVYMPVDLYEDVLHIERDWRRLRYCDLVVAHNSRQQKYFRGYVRVAFVDYHLKYILPRIKSFSEAGSTLWVGNHGNLPPLIEWVNSHSIPACLHVVTDRPDEVSEQLRCEVEVTKWSPRNHQTALQTCRAAIDVKGESFRARHKPPAKALDYIASGIPFAIIGRFVAMQRKRDFHWSYSDERC